MSLPSRTRGKAGELLSEAWLVRLGYAVGRPLSGLYDRLSPAPQVLYPPESAPVCCSQQTITVGREVHGKAAQKHDYPSAAHRVSYVPSLDVD